MFCNCCFQSAVNYMCHKLTSCRKDLSSVPSPPPHSMHMQGRQDVRLYYGTRNSDATAYSDLDDSWKSVGVDTVHVYSDEDKGYVQDVFSQVILLPACQGQRSEGIQTLSLAALSHLRNPLVISTHRPYRRLALHPPCPCCSSIAFCPAPAYQPSATPVLHMSCRMGWTLIPVRRVPSWWATRRCAKQ